MRRRRVRYWFGLLAVAGPAAVAGEVDPLIGHFVAARATVDALPAAIAPLFQSRFEEFQANVAAPARDWPRDRAMSGRGRWHYVYADIAATSQDQVGRRVAVRDFPHGRSQAERAYRSGGLRRGGELPWAIERCFNELVVAFRKADASVALARAGWLAHFASDAADPFRVSRNDRGRRTGNLTFGVARGPHPPSAWYSVRERFGVGLLQDRAGALAAAIRLTPADCEPAMDPIESAFAVIAESLELHDEIAGIDRDILAKLGVADREAFRRQQPEYDRRWHARCGALRVDRLHAAAALAARLIGGAYQLAGSPSLYILGEGQPPDEPVASPESDAPAFVASRNSVVFHTPKCKFAEQIHKDNLETFTTISEARAGGRRPCKRCGPE